MPSSQNQSTDSILDSIGKLESNWNSYGADPIPRESIQLAREAVEILRRNEFQIARIGPTGDRSVWMTCEIPRGYLVVEAYEEGVIVVLSDIDSVQRTLECKIDGLEAALSEFKTAPTVTL